VGNEGEVICSVNVQEIINKWYELASGGNVERAEPFFQFVAVWVAFNALYTSRHSDDIGDWDQIRSFQGNLKSSIFTESYSSVMKNIKGLSPY
jgi:hypothetical protein